jgi:hypothetical protein
MGLPEWMLSVDSRKTRTLHDGTCIQFLLHFKGTLIHEIGGSQSSDKYSGLLRFQLANICVFQKSFLPPTLRTL